jgi:hypothetical protein
MVVVFGPSQPEIHGLRTLWSSLQAGRKIRPNVAGSNRRAASSSLVETALKVIALTF